MKKILSITIALLMLLTSCELMVKEVKPDIKLVSVALGYSGANKLDGTLNDQKGITTQFELLAEKSGYNFTSYQFSEISGNFYFNGNLLGDKSFTDDLELLFNDTLQNNSSDNDIIIFYYSGHGADSSFFGHEYNGALWIGLEKIPYEGSQTAIAPQNFLTMPTLHDYITSLKGKKLIILDSCFSGEVVEDTENALSNTELFQKGFEKLFSQEQIDNKNTWYITSSSSDSESYEDDGLGHGYFSFEFLKGLGYDPFNNIAISSSPLGTDGKITLNELYNYTYENVNKNYGGQTTQKGKSVIDLVLFKWD